MLLLPLFQLLYVGCSFFVVVVTPQDAVSVQHSDLHYFPELNNMWSQCSLNALCCVSSVGFRAGNQNLLLLNACDINYMDKSNIG